MRVVELLLAASQFLLALVQSDFALLEFVLNLQYALVALLHLLFKFSLFVEEVFFYFEEFFSLMTSASLLAVSIMRRYFFFST